MTALPSFFARRPGTLLAFLFGLLLAGCSVLFIAPYDATTDRLLTDLTVLTETVVVKADNDQLPVGEREKFYAEAEGTVNAMKMRAGLYAKNEQEITALDELAKRYRALHERHASPRTSLTTGLRATLLDVQQIQVRKNAVPFSAVALTRPALHSNTNLTNPLASDYGYNKPHQEYAYRCHRSCQGPRERLGKLPQSPCQADR